MHLLNQHVWMSHFMCSLHYNVSAYFASIMQVCILKQACVCVCVCVCVCACAHAWVCVCVYPLMGVMHPQANLS